MMPAQPKELVVLVADADAETVLSALLQSRQASLGVRIACHDVVKPPKSNDAWVFRRAHEYLREVRRTYQRAIVVLDWHGSGGESKAAEELEGEVESRARASGWPEGAVAVVVIDPELEAWAWGRSDRAAQILGLPEQQLLDVLAGFGLSGDGKVGRPKEALEAVVARCLHQRPKSSRVHARMAREMGRLDDCQDRAFRKLVRVLREWFPAEES
ncbi:MAG: hypothetical protein FJX75_11995 [Armatimonadetes bacterium]|nr:hypothetical protein [Armatimonadota bacterium]